MQNKKKIINDPLYGFISIPSELIFDIISHPYFQRLRRIRQLGLAEYVYPGANHTRFQHALGAMHLMTLALETLQTKGIEISYEEKEAAQIAILLHDIGHGPFSHVLEKEILHQIHHEEVTLILMKRLNESFNNRLDLAIQIFEGTYARVFFHQLVSSQLDMDRMDYLNRDCFFTGVVEGTIGVDRIIKLLNVHNDELVVEGKGLLSVENFLNARRLMYWQVYLHKTSIAAESMLVAILQRAKYLLKEQISLSTTPALAVFLNQPVTLVQLSTTPSLLDAFIQLDDFDIWNLLKLGQDNEDAILKKLCNNLINRNLFKISIQRDANFKIQKGAFLQQLKDKKVEEEEWKYYFREGKVSNKAYIAEDENIKIMLKDKIVKDISDASDLPNIKALTHIVEKYYFSWFQPTEN